MIIWALVDFDGVFNIIVLHWLQLMKETSVIVDGTLHYLVSYYRQWDTMNRPLILRTDRSASSAGNTKPCPCKHIDCATGT